MRFRNNFRQAFSLHNSDISFAVDLSEQIINSSLSYPIINQLKHNGWKLVENNLQEMCKALNLPEDFGNMA